MKLINVINEKEEWLKKGYEVFSYDREKMIEDTRKDPEWVHFGAGNLFRAFQAVFCDKLLDEGVLNKGIIAVGVFVDAPVREVAALLNEDVIDIALEAMRQAGVEPQVKPIRGGTDGAQLSFKGLPCPNIFAGGLNFHGPYEFVPIPSMEKAMRVVVKICELTAKQIS